MNKITWKNRILALLLAVFMTVGAIPAQAFAEDDSPVVVVPETQQTEAAEGADKQTGEDSVEDVTLVDQTIKATIISQKGEVPSAEPARDKDPEIAADQEKAAEAKADAEPVFEAAQDVKAEESEPKRESVSDAQPEEVAPAIEQLASKEDLSTIKVSAPRKTGELKSPEIKSADTADVKSADDAGANLSDVADAGVSDIADAEADAADDAKAADLADAADATDAEPADSADADDAEISDVSETPQADDQPAANTEEPAAEPQEQPAENTEEPAEQTEDPATTEPQDQAAENTEEPTEQPEDPSAAEPQDQPADQTDTEKNAQPEFTEASQPAGQSDAAPEVQPADNNEETQSASQPEVILSGKLPAAGIVTARPVSPEIADLSPIAAFDIKVYANSDKLASDSPWQPQEPIRVRIQSDALAGRTDALDIYHIPDGSFTPEFVATVQPTDSAVVFPAESFSVYVVVDHEETGTVVTPRVVFHFIADGAISYGAGSSAYYEGDPYSFINKHNDTQTTQILSNGEALEFINDPTNQASKYFYGWYLVDPHVISGTTDANGIGTSNGKLYYSWPLAPESIAFESAIAISESNVSIGDTIHWTMNGVSGSGEVDAEGNIHVFLAPLFENYNFINFMLHPKGQDATVMTRKLIARGSSADVDVKISDIRSTSTDPVHLIFTGWEYNAGTDADPDWREYQTVDYTGAEITDPGRDGTYLTVNLNDTSSIDLYPVFIEARWVDFFAGVSGSGASYVASRFRESWGTPTNPPAGMTEDADKNVFTSLDTSSRAGYTFEGWYAFAVVDEHTGEITNLSTPADVTINYININNKFEILSRTVSTTAVKVADGSGNICYAGSGVCGIKDNGNGTYSLVTDGSGEIALFGAGTSANSLKFYDELDRLKLCANWTPLASKITVIYWTENAQDEGYTAPGNVKEDYTASAIKVVTTTELNAQLGTSYASGSTLTLSELEAYTDSSVSILAPAYLDNAGAVLAGEEKFYDLNQSLSDGPAGRPVTIRGDGSTVFNVYYERKTFKLVFHIGRDGYVKENGQQRESYMDPVHYPQFAGWDGNWIQFMYKDWKVNNAPDHATKPGLGYAQGPTAISYSVTNQNFSMTYDGKTYTSAYVTTSANVLGDYVPADDENVYVITAKYGAYIGDRWPTPTNPNFSFTDPAGSTKTMYTWAAYYDSLYCYIAHHRSTYGNPNGNNPDINGVYDYMSAELCTNRAGDDIINANQVHHLVAYFGDKGKAGIEKTYHVMYKAIDGTYDPGSVTLVHGADYLTYNQTTWSAATGNGDSAKVNGYDFYEVFFRNVISNVEPQFQMGWEFDGYDYVYSCYNTPVADDHHIYFFYEPKQYTLTFNIGGSPQVDTYYYTQPLAGADLYTDLVTVPEGYYFAGWFTNAEGVGRPFNFAAETMPDQNVVLYPILKVLQYTVKIDPNGGVIDHMANSAMATYFTGNYGTPVGEYSVERGYIKLNDKEQTSTDPTYYTGTKYYYINTQRKGAASEGSWGLPSDLRNALYLTESELDDYYENVYLVKMNAALLEKDALGNPYWEGIQILSKSDFIATYADYPYRPVNGEHYTFMGWFQVYDDGSVASMPYNFNDPVHGPLELRALWRLDGGYYVQYNPYFYEDDGNGSVTVIAGELQDWTDPGNPTNQLYADQTPTHILRAPTNTTHGWVFRGWRVVKANGTSTYQGDTYTNWEPFQFDGNGDPIYYQPGDTFLIDAELVSDSNIYGGIIHMQAYYERESTTYRRPDVTNLILDANDTYGRGYVNTSDPTDIPAFAGPGSIDINTTSELYTDTHSVDHPTQILFGNIQSNLALHLFQYATTKTFGGHTGTNFFTSEDGYLLIGFDENSDPESPTTSKAYVPAFAADSIAAVTRNETNKVLYAMWEPMVYVTFVNTTDAPITVELSGIGSTVSIVNEVTGEFDRKQTTTTITVPAKSGGVDGRVKVVLPKGAGQTLTATATNDHLRKKMSVAGEYPSGTAYGTGSTEIKYGNDVTYTGTLVTDAEGIVVTYTEIVDAQVIYDVNGGTWNPLPVAPPYQYSTGDLYFIEASDIINGGGDYEPDDPAPPANKIFIGWTDNADIAAHTDFSSASAVTWGSTTITPDADGIVLDKIRSDYLWEFSQDAALLYDNDKTLYAVWSDAVTVTFNVAYSSNLSANPLKLHTWTHTEQATDEPYKFYRSDSNQPLITYTMAKGEKVSQPSDPVCNDEQPTWNFIKWLISSGATDSYRYNAKSITDNAFQPDKQAFAVYDFAQRVVGDTTLVTSWTETRPQIFTFTIRNELVGGSTDAEFDYTIAVSNEWVRGKLGNSTSNVNGVPDQRWGSVTTKLKQGQAYTVIVKVSYITNWGGANSVDITVIDRDGVVVKSGHVIYCNKNTYKNFVENYKYTLTITQDSSANGGTVVSTDNLIGSITSSTNNASRSFTFNSCEFRTAGQESDFTPEVNNYATGNTIHAGNNSLTIVFTNTVLAAPTNYHVDLHPFIIMLNVGAALALMMVCGRKTVLAEAGRGCRQERRRAKGSAVSGGRHAGKRRWRHSAR